MGRNVDVLATPLPHEQKRNIPRYVLHAFVRLYADSGRMDIVHSFAFNGDGSPATI